MRRSNRSRRRWPRFSLRTLLIVTTLLAIWLAFKVNEARHRAIALRAVQNLGGFLEYEHQFPNGKWGGNRRNNAPLPGPDWLRDLFGADYFVRPVGLQFAEKPIDDEDLAHVAHLTDLQYLSFLAGRGDHRIHGHGLVHLNGLSKLRVLDLLGHPVSDDALKALDDLTHLESLDLRSTKVTDAGLAHLTSLPSLRHLALDNTQISDQGLMHLTSLRSLQTVLVRNTKVTAQGVAALQKELPNCKVMRTFSR